MGNCVSSMGKQNSQARESISPASGKNEGKLFHKNSHPGNLCVTGGGNEREIRFHHKFQLHITVLSMLLIFHQRHQIESH